MGEKVVLKRNLYKKKNLISVKNVRTSGPTVRYMSKHYSKIVTITIFLLIMPFMAQAVTSEQVAFGICYQRNGTPINISGTIYCQIEEVYTPITELSDNAVDQCAQRNGTTVNVKGAILCKVGEFYLRMEDLSLSATSSPDAYQVALSLCAQQNGTAINIQGTIYCKTGEEYKPLNDLLKKDTVTIMGVNMPDFGRMISEKNPTMGWIILIVGLIVIYSYFKDQREIRIERELHRIPRYESERMKKKERNSDTRRRRSDGGFY